MSLTDRDRKILIGIVPLLVLAAYWFLLLSPKREEASTAATELTEQVERRDAARAAAGQADTDKTDFAADYGEIVRLGKAIPAKVDMASLLVQLERAAEGTDISFTRISTGERVAIAAAAPAPATPNGSSGSTPPGGAQPAQPTEAGGQPAQSAPGAATEAANNAAATSDQANAAAQQSGVPPADTQTSTTAREGGLPVGGAAGGTSATTSSTQPAAGGLESVPLELEFVGNFFQLADFFHDVKRFVHVVNNDVVVNGRLVTIDSVRFASETDIFPRVRAELTATIFLSPMSQGVTAGATPAGPAAPSTTPASTTPAPTGGSTPAPTPAPTAAATP